MSNDVEASHVREASAATRFFIDRFADRHMPDQMSLFDTVRRYRRSISPSNDRNWTVCSAGIARLSAWARTVCRSSEQAW